MARAGAQAAAETAGPTHASLKALLENACWPCYCFRHDHRQPSGFSIAFAVMAVAIAEYVMWILEQNGWVNP